MNNSIRILDLEWNYIGNAIQKELLKQFVNININLNNLN